METQEEGQVRRHVERSLPHAFGPRSSVDHGGHYSLAASEIRSRAPASGTDLDGTEDLLPPLSTALVGKGDQHSMPYSSIASADRRNTVKTTQLEETERPKSTSRSLARQDRVLGRSARPTAHPQSWITRALDKLETALRWTPIGRTLAWLRQCRAAAPCLPEPCSSGYSGMPASFRRDGGGPHRPLLPMHLPPEPPAFSPVWPGRGGSRRVWKRTWSRQVAWRLTEWQIAACNYWEMSSPSSAAALAEKLGPYEVSWKQNTAFHALLMDNLSFCRLSGGADCPSTGRGLQRLQLLLTAFESAWRLSPATDVVTLPQSVLQSALPVNPDRIALRDPAGTVRPEDILDPAKAEAFLRVSDRILDLPPKYPITRSRSFATLYPRRTRQS